MRMRVRLILLIFEGVFVVIVIIVVERVAHRMGMRMRVRLGVLAQVLLVLLRAVMKARGVSRRGQLCWLHLRRRMMLQPSLQFRLLLLQLLQLLLLLQQFQLLLLQLQLLLLLQHDLVERGRMHTPAEPARRRLELRLFLLALARQLPL